MDFDLSLPPHRYGDGSELRADVGTDTVTVAGFTMENVIVESGGISVANEHGLAFLGYSGLMGFAWSSISKSKLPTFVEQLANTTTLAQDVFSFYLARGFDSVDAHTADTTPNGTVNAGSLTIGGVDQSTVRASDFCSHSSINAIATSSQGISTIIRY
jgi:hypothetical protein